MTQIKAKCRECHSEWQPKNTENPEDCQCPKCGSGRVIFEQTSFNGRITRTNINTASGEIMITIALNDTGTANEVTAFLLGDKVEVSHEDNF